VIKENLKNSRITGLNLQGKTIKVAGDFLTETWQARREWYDIYKVLKGKNLQPRITKNTKIQRDT